MVASGGNGKMSADIVETTDEEGNIHVFEKVEEFEFEGREYALLIYQGGDEEGEEGENDGDDDDHEHHEGCNHAHGDDDDDDKDDGHHDEVVVMRVAHEEEFDVFEAIEDEEEFNRVVKFIEESSFDIDEDAEVIDLEALIGSMEEDTED